MSETTAGHPAAVPTGTAATTSVAPAAHAAIPMTFLQVGMLGLRATGEPMSAKDIIAWADANGVARPLGGRTPERTLNRDLHAAIRRGDARLAHGPKRGLFVATSQHRPRPDCAAEPTASTDRDSDLPDVRRVLPVAPLAAAIEARGGLRACGMRYDPGDRDDLVRRVERLARAYLRARIRGYIGIYDADELAVSALGVHPVLVYGPLWWDEPAATAGAATETVALAAA